MGQKSFDVILIGATGFTGSQAAAYFKKHAPEHLKWGICGRNQEKLQQLASELSLPEGNIFVADILNKAQTEAVVQQAKIIVTTAGPFSLYGEQVIAACATFGTHYLDITGETDFIQSMHQKYGKNARLSGSVLIPFSGFDSVPSDLSALLLSRRLGNPDKLHLQHYYTIKGGVNGGTIASMLHKMEKETAADHQHRFLWGDAAHTDIQPAQKQRFFGYDRTIGRWITPFIMAPVNTPVIQTSAAVAGDGQQPYSGTFTISEHAKFGKWYRPWQFIAHTILLNSLAAFGKFTWFRALLRAFLPKPGEGPSRQEIENGFFKLKAIAKDGYENRAYLHMRYSGDPSNKSTVFFLCESALLLTTLTENKMPAPGFHTPATAFGTKLANRLKEKGLHLYLKKR